jgi:hypothetical protein
MDDSPHDYEEPVGDRSTLSSLDKSKIVPSEIETTVTKHESNNLLTRSVEVFLIIIFLYDAADCSECSFHLF